MHGEDPGKISIGVSQVLHVLHTRPMESELHLETALGIEAGLNASLEGDKDVGVSILPLNAMRQAYPKRPRDW